MSISSNMITDLEYWIYKELGYVKKKKKSILSVKFRIGISFAKGHDSNPCLCKVGFPGLVHTFPNICSTKSLISDILC